MKRAFKLQYLVWNRYTLTPNLSKSTQHLKRDVRKHVNTDERKYVELTQRTGQV
jgi:hypothetical protein